MFVLDSVGEENSFVLSFLGNRDKFTLDRSRIGISGTNGKFLVR